MVRCAEVGLGGCGAVLRWAPAHLSSEENKGLAVPRYESHCYKAHGTSQSACRASVQRAEVLFLAQHGTHSLGDACWHHKTHHFPQCTPHLRSDTTYQRCGYLQLVSAAWPLGTADYGNLRGHYRAPAERGDGGLPRGPLINQWSWNPPPPGKKTCAGASSPGTR